MKEGETMNEELGTIIAFALLIAQLKKDVEMLTSELICLRQRIGELEAARIGAVN